MDQLELFEHFGIVGNGMILHEIESIEHFGPLKKLPVEGKKIDYKSVKYKVKFFEVANDVNWGRGGGGSPSGEPTITFSVIKRSTPSAVEAFRGILGFEHPCNLCSTAFITKSSGNLARYAPISARGDKNSPRVTT